MQIIRQEPKPLPLKRPHAAFLEDSIDRVASPTHKRFCPDSVHSSVTQWVESGSESHRDRHCRSDSFLSHLDREIPPRVLTKSAPIMDSRRDADGFDIPTTPASTGSRSFDQSFGPSDVASSAAGSGRSSGRRLVEDPRYRSINWL